MALPAFGIVSQVFPTFSRKPLFGYYSMVYATSSIGLLSFMVWAHHMFVTGMPAVGQLFFMYATMLIAVPTGVKVFNWIGTMWEGAMTFETPMLFAIGFLCLFTIGGLSGVTLSMAALDVQLHGTYYVVAHFHYVLVAGALFSLFSAIYYWFPKMTGKMYHEGLGKFHFWWSMIWFNVTFFPMHFLGLAGMPRRIPDYPLQFTELNSIASIGAFMFGLGQLIFLYNIVMSIRSGQPAPHKPWEGGNTLEWEIPTPAPYHSFAEAPTLEVGENGVIHAVKGGAHH
jgi:cytochrome c oxidase subunit 1